MHLRAVQLLVHLVETIFVVKRLNRRAKCVQFERVRKAENKHDREDEEGEAGPDRSLDLLLPVKSELYGATIDIEARAPIISWMV